jgi:hypothetical protein
MHDANGFVVAMRSIARIHPLDTDEASSPSNLTTKMHPDHIAWFKLG